MKYLLSILSRLSRRSMLLMLSCLFIAGCAYDSYSSGNYDPYGVDYNSYRDSYGSYGETSLPDSPIYEVPEFRFDYGSHYNITQEDYNRIRDLERMNDRLNRLEGLREWRQEASRRMHGPLGRGSMPGDSLLR